MIEKDEAGIIKLVSLMFIIYSHFLGWIVKDSFIASTGIGASISQCGVSLFLFLSGYGIYKSYKKSGFQKYWYKRITRIYISFLIVIIPQFLLEIWKYHENIGDMYIASTVLSALGLYSNNLIDGTMWFIPFILLQYFIFYVSFRLKYHAKLMVLGEIIVYIIFKRCFVWVNENDFYVIAFALGVLYAEKEKAMEQIYRLGTVVISFLVWIITYNFYDFAVIRMINCLSFMIFILCIIHFSYNDSRKKEIFNRIQVFGDISYELYLTEAIFFFHPIIYDFVGYNYCGLVIHVILIFVMAFIIKSLSGKIQMILDRRFINDRKL